MKLEKTASGSKKVTISKSEWVHIGKKAGWMDKKASGGAVNDPRSLKQEMNAAISELNHMTGLLSLSQQYANTPGELFRSGKGLYGGCQVDALQTLQNSNVKIDDKGTQWIGVNSAISPVLSKWWEAVKMAKTALLDQAGNPTKNNPLDVTVITDAMNSIKSLRTELDRFNKLVVLNSSIKTVKTAQDPQMQGRNNKDAFDETTKKDLYTIVHTSEVLLAHAQNLQRLVNSNENDIETSRSIAELSAQLLSDMGWIEKMKPSISNAVEKMMG